MNCEDVRDIGSALDEYVPSYPQHFSTGGPFTVQCFLEGVGSWIVENLVPIGVDIFESIVPDIPTAIGLFGEVFNIREIQSIFPFGQRPSQPVQQKPPTGTAPTTGGAQQTTTSSARQLGPNWYTVLSFLWITNCPQSVAIKLYRKTKDLDPTGVSVWESVADMLEIPLAGKVLDGFTRAVPQPERAFDQATYDRYYTAVIKGA